jgi:tetratricopeptide (TPR) repeat protein
MKISGKLLLVLLLILSVLITSVPCKAQTQAQAAEAIAAQDRWVAVVTSAQGGVYVQRSGQNQWEPLAVNDKCYPGDSVRVEENSRAALLFKNDSTLRIDQNSTLSFQPMEDQTILMRIFNGAACFFSRIPRSLKIFTPHMNGTVKGTEFVIRVDGDQTQINLFDGQILAENEKGDLLISKGQSVIAKTGQAPVAQAVVRPRDAVQWALHYPAIMDFSPEDFPGGADWQQKVRQSIGAWRRGDLSGAFGVLKGIEDAGIRDTRYFAYRATLALAVGRAQEASVWLDRIIETDPKNANAYALQSIVATAQNNNASATDLATRAVSLDPQSSTARIALSYAQQALFDIRGATASVQEAVRVTPNDAYARSRLAELWLMQGWLNRALEEAQRAVSIKPELARTQTVLGFAYLMQVKVADSRAAFEKAIRLDSADPLPRLGLGLAIIRRGGLEEGRREIEIAASLDVNNSLIRSYLGKAYYEEKRENLSATQLGIAKELDPKDPTPWFYDAILKQSVNRPVEALQDIQKSIELNSNRAVFRSKLLLDQDLAARSASQGRIYNNLGFQQLALVEGWKGVNYDPTDFSSHRLLAESYGSLNRHQIAQASELLQAQMLQPININPVPLQLADTNLNIQQGAGPSSPAYNEYNPLFNRNQIMLQAGGVLGQQNTYGDEVTLNGVYDRYSMSLGQLYYKTDGFRVNNDLKKEIYNLFAQASLTYQTSVQAELRYTDDRNGDLPLRFNPALTDETLRSGAYASSVRLGLRHSFTPNSDLLVSLSYRDAHYNDTSSDEFFNYDFPQQENGYMGEIQYLFRSDRFRAIVGGGYASVMGSGEINITMPMPPDPPIPILNQPYDNDTHHTNGYLYTYTNWPQPVTWTIGVSYDKQTIGFYGHLEQDQVNPKIGMTWNPLAGTTVRAAAFRALQRTLLTGQTLEPTQVAGFNQFYHDGTGTDSWHYGVGLDQKITDSLFAGAEGSYRDLKTPYLSISRGPQTTSWEEKTARVYLYWAPHKWFALSAEYQYERSDSKPEAPQPGDLYSTKINTHKVPLGAQFFHPMGLFAGVRATYVAQDVTTAETIAIYPYTYYDASDNFWVFDAAIGYRLPKRYGIISVEAKNLFNTGFNFTDTNAANPAIQPQRLIVGKITLYF